MTPAEQALSQVFELLECPTAENVGRASVCLEECSRVVTPENAGQVRGQLTPIRELLESAWSLRLEYLRRLTVEASGYTASGGPAQFTGRRPYEVKA
jgi:hypothetical protein